GDYPAAILNLREAVRKAPTHTQARLALGSALLHTGDPEAAEQQLRQALDFGLPTHEALVPLARALLLQGKYEELLREVAAAGASATRSPDLLTLMGLAHLGADR